MGPLAFGALGLVIVLALAAGKKKQPPAPAGAPPPARTPPAGTRPPPGGAPPPAPSPADVGAGGAAGAVAGGAAGPFPSGVAPAVDAVIESQCRAMMNQAIESGDPNQIRQTATLVAGLGCADMAAFLRQHADLLEIGG